MDLCSVLIDNDWDLLMRRMLRISNRVERALVKLVAQELPLRWACGQQAF